MNNSEADFESEKLIAELNALDSKIDALDLTKRIEFFRLYRILNATIDAISNAENDLEELTEKHREALKFANNLFLGFFASALVLSIVNHFFYPISWFTSLPTWLLISALLYPSLSEPMQLQKLVRFGANAIDRYRFEARCAGFTIHLLNELNMLLKTTKDDYRNSYRIELLQKNECLRLCHAWE